MWLCEGLRSEVLTALSHKILGFENYYINLPAPETLLVSLPLKQHVLVTLLCPSNLVPLPAQPRPRQHTSPPEVWLTNSHVNPTTAPSSSSPSSCIAYTAEPPPILTPHICATLPSPCPIQMSSEYPNLFTMARGKLHAAVGGRDKCDLHRWVLLKNSVFRSQTSPPPSVLSTPSSSLCVLSENVVDDEEDGADSNSFMFPDASKLIPRDGTDMTVSEAEWLDSLLETLCEGEEDDMCADSDVQVSVVAVEEDDDSLSPLTSPMSSSDDLLSHQAHFSLPVPVPYPVPYPPFHPPLVRPYELGPIIEPRLISPPRAYALSRYDIDELDELAVPEAIEDTSDDESDTPSTPSLGRSSDLSFGATLLEDGPKRTRPEVYIRTTGSDYDHLELDSLFA